MSHWVAAPEQLDSLANDVQTAPLPLDTEFIRERTYYPKLALVQLRLPQGQEYLIDPLALPEAGPLAASLQGGPVKIMHSPSEDLQAFEHGWKLVVEPIFDTQLAAALVGMGAGLSYQSLVEALLQVHLEKGETRSNWMQRPLTDSQRHYAAEDVRHLHAVYDILHERLASLGRLEWLQEDCARMVDTVRDDTPDPNPHLTSRSAQHMDRDAQARLRRLMLWREHTARQRDLPRSWVLDNQLIVLLAERPYTRAAFETLLDRQTRAPRRGRGAIWEEVSRPLEDSERDIPLAIPPDPALRQPLKAMRAVVAKHAEQLDIPEGLLCARRHLESLLAERQWPTALEGWRAEILRDELMPLLP